VNFFSRFLKKQGQQETRRPNIGDRIPDSLQAIAKKGEYRRLNPYPLEAIAEEFKGSQFVTKQTKIVTMGSCFAQELKAWLHRNNFTCLPHEWGVIYSPQSIRQIIHYSLSRSSWKPVEPFWRLNGRYYNPYIKSDDHTGPQYLGETEHEAYDALEAHYKKSSALLREADLVVWTLGLTELWRNRIDRLTYFSIPYPQIYDEQIHEFYNLEYPDVVNDLRYAITTLKKHNPKVRVLISVSPVPLSISFRPELGPYVATQYSKSLLVTAAMTIVREFDELYYMPSYEITRNDPMVNYSPDGRHVSRDCVESIMKLFQSLYVAGDKLGG
jgi:hypothetical protein